jgi:hypothetical protein
LPYFKNSLQNVLEKHILKRKIPDDGKLVVLNGCGSLISLWTSYVADVGDVVRLVQAYGNR